MAVITNVFTQVIAGAQVMPMSLLPVPPTKGFGGPTQFRMIEIGSYKIEGTVKLRNSPDNTPLSRRVFLIPQDTLSVLDATWSDPVTGVYSFIGLRGGRKFMVVSTDHTGQHRAVISDSLEATL